MAKTNRKISASYLTTDGTLAQIIIEETRNGVKIGETAEVTYGWATVGIRDYSGNRVRVDGRIVIHRYDESYVTLAKGGRVEATLPNRESGSEKTKTLGYDVQYVKITTKNKLELSWTDVTSIISSAFTVQSGAQYLIADNLKVGDLFWSGVYVSKVTDLRKV
ncbi:unnamed protein product [Sphagnum tenellum]